MDDDATDLLTALGWLLVALDLGDLDAALDLFSASRSSRGQVGGTVHATSSAAPDRWLSRAPARI